MAVIELPRGVLTRIHWWGLEFVRYLRIATTLSLESRKVMGWVVIIYIIGVAISVMAGMVYVYRNGYGDELPENALIILGFMAVGTIWPVALIFAILVFITTSLRRFGDRKYEREQLKRHKPSRVAHS